MSLGKCEKMDVKSSKESKKPTQFRYEPFRLVDEDEADDKWPSVILAAIVTIFLLASVLYFSRIVDDDPPCIPADDVKFYLYSLQHPDTEQVVTIKDTNSIKNSTFDPKLPSKYLIHGWAGDKTAKVNRLVKSALFSVNHNVNVIVVEWKQCASSPTYKVVKSRLKGVAKIVARFIDLVENMYPGQLNRTELVGHSFGGHVVGLAAKNVKAGKVDSIVGLDPAGKLFSIDKPEERLDRGDANYVEVIHTSTIGFAEPIGTVDHYPNYGLMQPGCRDGLCNHMRAILYFAVSISGSKDYVAQQCGSYSDIKDEDCHPTGSTIKVGGDPLHTTNPSGVFYFKTSPEDSFAKVFPREELYVKNISI